MAKLSEKLLDYTAYKKILSKEAHLNFKQDLTRTTLAARRLSSILGGFLDPNFKKMFLRVLSEGNWEKAKVYAKRNFSSKALKNPQKSGEQQKKPWVVLVTGLNGIRKTSSINSSWFQQVLFEALEDQLGGSGITQDCLPDGSNSFFRHLDHILSTVTNEEFRKLYNISDVEIYAKLKNALFMRYRTLAEIFGVMFIEEAVRKNMNVYLETSGRDTSMIEYVNHFFPDGKYNKCLVHFTINDVKFAQQSVDKRMMYEMKKGSEALKGSRGIDRVVGVIEVG